MQQEQVDNVRVTLCDIQPCFERPTAPLEFVSCRSKGIKGTVRDLCIQRLPDRERRIIDMRFFEGKTQTEVAEEIHISQAQVSRLEKSALKSMKHYLS